MNKLYFPFVGYAIYYATGIYFATYNYLPIFFDQIFMILWPADIFLGSIGQIQ